MRIVGMTSGEGDNIFNLVEETRSGSLDAEVVGLISDRKSPALEEAEERGLDSEHVPLDSDTKEEHEKRIAEKIRGFDADIVAVDGYMPIFSPYFIDEFRNKILNVHPSLLPSFRTTNPWRDALEAGVEITGCTVHVVTEEIAMGPIVTQEPVRVLTGDDPESLRERIKEAEHRAYPRAISMIVNDEVEFDDGEINRNETEGMPKVWDESFDKVDDLRYGENPHQEAAVYADTTSDEPSVASAPQVSGEKGMSYVNIVDAEGALDLIKEFEKPAAAVIKHANPAGCATADTLSEAYDRALSTDPMSAFGGVVSLNRPCDVETAEKIVDSVKHVVVAPGFEDGALEVLGEREKMRVIDVSGGKPVRIGPDDRTESRVDKQITGGRLVQDRDRHRLSPEDLEVVTEREPTDEQIESMLFAWQVCKHVTSNAIVFADGTETVGLGVGQVSRVDAVELAGKKAREHAEGKGPDGAVMASDAFFPFPDGIEEAVDAGIEAVIQPGGSINDEDVIEAADDHGIAMVFTGMRCFKHQ